MPITAKYLARRQPELEATCPGCGAEAVYVPHLDRFMHVDGTDNTHCWWLILTGRVTP